MFKSNFIYVPTVVLKLFAGQGARRTTERTDGQSGDYMLPPLGSIMNVHRFYFQKFIACFFAINKHTTLAITKMKYLRFKRSRGIRESGTEWMIAKRWKRGSKRERV